MFPSGVAGTLQRARRVFKETRQNERRFGTRRKGNVDMWHSAGGTSARRGLPQDAPAIYRQYGAVKIDMEDGRPREAMFNYHEYRLVDPPEGAEHVKLFHVFAMRVKDKQKAAGAGIRAKGVKPQADKKSAVKRRDAGTTTPPPPELRQPLKTPSLGLSAPRGARGKRLQFMSFQRQGKCVGSFAESPAGGIQLESIGGDVAEWHRLADLEQGTLHEGDVVSLVDSEVSLMTTDDAGILGVVSHKAMVEGSEPLDTRRHVRIAYVGRVPVRVRGPVACGDYITPSGRNDGTGVKATGLHQRTVGCVISLGVAPGSAEEAWQVEIVAMPPQSSYGNPRVGLGAHALRLFVALCVVGMLCLCGRTLLLEGQGGSGQHSTVSANSILPCGRDGWDTVRRACKEELSLFYQGTTNPFGEGGIVNELQMGGYLEDAYTVAEKLDLGSVVWIGETCVANQDCPVLLRRYLDSCPLVPQNISAKSGRLHMPHILATPKTMESHVDILFARQCLSRRYPDLLSPPSLVASSLPAPSSGKASGAGDQQQQQQQHAATVSEANVCSATGLGLPQLSKACASCASTPSCVRRRQPEDYVQQIKACGLDKEPYSTGAPDLADAYCSDCGTEGSSDQESYVVIPTTTLPQVVGDMNNVLRFEYASSPTACGASMVGSSCTCYAAGSKCAQAMSATLQMLVQHPECTTESGNHDAAAPGVTASVPHSAEFPSPSGLALMLAASRGDRFLPVVPL
jgi:hypothetical protein